MLVRRRIVIVLGVVVALAAAAKTAYAAAPREATTINGCVNKQTGVLRVATPARGCITKPGLLQETPIQWSAVGASAPVPTVPSPTTGGAQVERRTATRTIPGRSALQLVRADCRSDETVVTGSWTANGESPYGNRAVSYSLGDTGERENGYQVVAGPGFVSLDETSGPDPVTVVVTAVCLKIA